MSHCLICAQSSLRSRSSRRLKCSLATRQFNISRVTGGTKETMGGHCRVEEATARALCTVAALQA